MVRRSETFGTLGRVSAVAEAKAAARIAAHGIAIVDTNADELDFPELAN